MIGSIVHAAAEEEASGILIRRPYVCGSQYMWTASSKINSDLKKIDARRALTVCYLPQVFSMNSILKM